ncbi:hypothetical protein [Marinitenerispora sediminis]|uniref:L-2-amino-thiazoline-4-carboxylic acid hydrolase n=1 Tax=Marinitenerispora sediminis TaxID=1931232 RepID=A0A368T8J6_9ACTN|nr:hypothetical protein [Marinitenerispora sediminis]RCV55060.1 hypothetical protein DEF28_06725 [Marinitenerispora sediminis]RCV58025.1 hypothetical protein DEF23_09760 [Marinitenerispora sediminis]RCV60706.1 hypothetical protein DEF24_06385 [Marinitenerispora sediminis]
MTSTDLEPRHPRPAAVVTMSAAERAALWRRRVVEATAGMTDHLVRRHPETAVTEWPHTLSEILAGLPEPGDEDPAAWQRVFFRAQALMEHFLVSRYGLAELQHWARANATVHRRVEPERGGGAADVVTRLAGQAELYGSDYEVTHAGPYRAGITITHCAIWDYRERARARGVPITLESPCQYCTLATSANFTVRGYRAGHRLLDGPDGHGCEWEASAPAGHRPAPPAPGREG